jgi:hypothetical protein
LVVRSGHAHRRRRIATYRCRGLEERFGGAVLTYETAEELRALVEHFLARPQERAARGAAGRELVLGRETFGHRVDALLALAAVAPSPTQRHTAAGAAR